MFKFDLLENEKTISLVRQSEMVLLKPVLTVFILIYVPWYFLIKYELAANYSRLLFAWTILVFLYAAYKYFLWLLNVNLVTDKRLACIDYKSLAKKRISESPLDRIANISVSTSGTFPALFGFGNVEIQLMNITEPLVFKNVRNPAKIKDLIWNIRNKTASTKPNGPTADRRVIIPAKSISPAQKRKIV